MLWSKLAARYNSVTLLSDSGLSDKLGMELGWKSWGVILEHPQLHAWLASALGSLVTA